MTFSFLTFLGPNASVLLSSQSGYIRLLRIPPPSPNHFTLRLSSCCNWTGFDRLPFLFISFPFFFCFLPIFISLSFSLECGIFSFLLFPSQSFVHFFSYDLIEHFPLLPLVSLLCIQRQRRCRKKRRKEDQDKAKGCVLYGRRKAFWLQRTTPFALKQ